MELKTYTDGAKWLQLLGVALPLAGRWHDVIPTATYQIPQDCGRKTALARLLIHRVFADRTIIFVVQEHGIWPSSENEFLFLKYRESISAAGEIDDFPFHVATPQEAMQVEGLLALSLYFLWGVTILNDTADLFIRTSHDEFMEVASFDADRLNAVTALLQEFGLTQP